MHFLKITLLLSIVVFVLIISLNNKVLAMRSILNGRHSMHNQIQHFLNTTTLHINEIYNHIKQHQQQLFLNNELHHPNQQHGNPNLQLARLQGQPINPILQSNLCPINKPRIVGGWTANETSFSHVAALLLCKAQTNKCPQMCGASIISETHILTAGHCVFHPKTLKLIEIHLLAVRIRTKDLSQPDNNIGPYRTTFQVQRVFVHPGYDRVKAPLLNDISIIKLQQTMTYAVPVCIAGLHFNYDLAAKPNLVVAGWGVVASGGPPSKVLKFAYVYVSNCGPYDARQFCAIAPIPTNGHTCHGDSGSGVLPVKQNSDAINLIVGIVSGGTNNNSSGGPLCAPPLFYTNVTTYANWINYIVGC